MNKFFAKGGQFWLDDQPMFIQAGEFHYFRTPPDQWPHRLGLLKAAGFNALATYIPWLWHQLEEGVSDFDGHSHPMRNLAGFLDLAAEMGFFIIARPGPYIMAETINEGIPPWVFKHYPQAAYISQDRKAQNIASYLHPDFLNCVKKWYGAIFDVLAPRQITQGGKIIMIQLDNEMGMIQWVRNIIDINPDTLSRFAAFLCDTYGERLPMRYPTDHLVEYLRDGIVTPKEPGDGKIVEDYRRFYRGYLREYASFLWSEAKSNGMDVLPVINIHGFEHGGKPFPIGLSQLIAVMGLGGMISATDVYPGFIGEGNFHQLLLVNEMTKALQNTDQPLFSVEFQAGGNMDFGDGQSSLYDLHSRLCISSGMRAINHYLFCDGENDPILSPVKRHDWGHPVRKDGTLRKHYFRYPKLSRVLDAYGSDLVRSQPKSIATIGFLLDYYMTEVNNGLTQELTNVIRHQRDTVLFDMLAKGLSVTHRPFRAVELSRGDLDVVQNPNCWVMMEKQCNAGTQQKLVDYLHQGGKLILAGRMCVEDFNLAECTILKDAIGIKQIVSDPAFVSRTISAFQYQDVPVSFLETYSGEFDEIFARSDRGEIVGFIRRVGKGKVMVFGAAMSATTLGDIDIINLMALKMDCLPLCKLDEWADVRLSQGDQGGFLFINNYQDDPIETTIHYEGHPILGGDSVYLPARRGLILPIDWQLNDDVTIHYVTSEIIKKTDDGSVIVLKTERNEFSAEISLRGYRCDHSIPVQASGDMQRVRLPGTQGTIVLRRGG
ncbi:MAG: beta-galactosidase [Anaerolineaceae bacterium]|nr:beta-galactosidase [Anaerolineaceae bacterium]